MNISLIIGGAVLASAVGYLALAYRSDLVRARKRLSMEPRTR